MIDYDKQFVAVLENILPTHYELKLHSGLKTPCISYQERDNAQEETGDTLCYGRISYTVKVWANEIAVIKKYAVEIDKALRSIGFRRISCGELHDNRSTMIQKIMAYEAKTIETF
jgi:hypothetical protein